MTHDCSIGIIVPSLIRKVGRSVVSSEELLSDLIIKGDVGQGVIQVLFNVIGGVGLIRRSGNKGGGSSVERHSDKRLFVRRELL
jgi:hypothetical protein